MPGHGASEDAAEPERCYTLEGQGATLLEVLDRLALYDAVLVGWSFGGHVVLQALAAGAGAKGAMIIGTPPLGRAPDIFPRAFLPNPCAPLAMKGSFTEDEAARFARSFFGAGTEVPDFVLEDCLRTDGRARTQLFAGLQQGRYADEAAFVRESRMPLAVMVGAEDDIVNADYIRGLEIGNLWRGEILSPEGVGHGPFWEDPDAFGDTLSAFVAEVTG